MRCISPLLIRKDGRRDVVPCGQCNFCLQTKRADWSFRIQYEAARASTGYFLTMTYEDENLPLTDEGLSTLVKSDLQKFIKRLRKDNVVATREQLRYYAVGEYGTITQRAHYHAIMLNLSEHIAQRLDRYWPFGHVHAGEVTEASIHYTTKYVINRTTAYPGRDPPFALMSRKPGLGAGYVDTHRHWHKDGMRNFTKVHGIQRRIPRYLKDKIFDRFDRAHLQREAVAASDESYFAEIERLAKYHADPYAYYDECVTTAHRLVHSKVNSLNKF